MDDSPDQDVMLFTEALRLRSAERSQYLDQACAGNAELRARIEALLKAYEKADDFLVEPAAGVPVGDVPDVGSIEKAGDRIGRYKLLQQIGEGGCGVVFMAEQEEPVRRRVALKIVKPGMDTKSVIARFEAERQALALMDHPSIAQVFDAGATENGRPYFVMELVRGVKITDYCDQNSLPTKKRLELFLQVCGAIQHAHQKGIIHRDIKPSNILVSTSGDGKALPKVIDFGIAKATTGQRLTDKTLFTAFEMLIGTPAYMSPEQAALTSVDVDTRSDIYSLGVLLYELLTSTTPFDTTELLKAGLDEVRRVIREQEPARPSTRLSTMMAADLTTISRHRGAEPPKLIRDVRGDLDWIVMKSMEKDRARRYPTANGLAVEVERYIHGEVVLARPASALYKTRKLIARNKLLFSAIVIIFVLLGAGLAVTCRLWMAERQARKKFEYRDEANRLQILAMEEFRNKKYPDAESNLRRALAIYRQFLPGEIPSALLAAEFVGALKTNNKTDEVEPFLAEFLKPGLYNLLPYEFLFAERVEQLAARGRWKEAAATASVLLEHRPDDYTYYHTLVPLLVGIQDVSGYHRICQQIPSRFKDAKTPFIADPMAKDCLILPSSGADLAVVGALADFAVGHGTNFTAYPFFQGCKALAEYRQGHYAGAIDWAHSAAKSPFPYANAEALATLAMAQFKLGQTNDAQNSLAACGKVIEEKMPKLGSGHLGQDWRDWIISHTLQEEARTLIHQDAK